MHLNEVIQRIFQNLLNSEKLSIYQHKNSKQEFSFLFLGQKFNLQSFVIFLQKPDNLELFPEEIHLTILKKKIDFSNALKEELNNLITQFKENLPEEVEENEMHPILKGYNLQVFIDMKDSSKKFVMNMESNQEAHISYSSLKELLSPHDFMAFRKAKPFKECQITYDPYNLEKFREFKIDGILSPFVEINFYNPPNWRKNPQTPTYPPLFQRYFEFFFPVKEEREIVFQWIKHAILHRVSYILLLVGRKGVGKNIFAEHIIKSLVGEKEFAKTQKGFFTGRFQDILENNRIIFIDEIEAKEAEAKKDLKRLPNHTQGIEKKGRDVEQKNIFYSVIIANNALDDIWIECDDRRFFIPELSDKQLKDEFCKDEIDEIVALCLDEKVVSSFGHWILEKEFDGKFDVENAFITKTFFKAVEASLKQTELFIKNYLTNEAKTKYIPLKTIQDDYGIFSDSKRSFITPKSINNFLRNYYHEGDFILGELIDFNGKKTVKLSDELCKRRNIVDETKSIDQLRDELS